MTVTVTQLKRALEEASCSRDLNDRDGFALVTVAKSPVALTILANRLSDRGTAGNDALARNLAQLGDLAKSSVITNHDRAALEWAIDQLTPPERV